MHNEIAAGSANAAAVPNAAPPHAPLAIATRGGTRTGSRRRDTSSRSRTAAASRASRSAADEGEPALGVGSVVVSGPVAGDGW